MIIYSMTGYISCVAGQLQQSGSSERSSAVAQSPIFVGEDGQMVKVSGGRQGVSDQEVVGSGILCRWFVRIHIMKQGLNKSFVG